MLSGESQPGQEQPGTQPEQEPGVEEQVTLKKVKGIKTETVSGKKVKISWTKLGKKDRNAAKMIEIQVSRDRSFTKDVITKKVKSSKASVKVGGLEKGKYKKRAQGNSPLYPQKAGNGGTAV